METQDVSTREGDRAAGVHPGARDDPGDPHEPPVTRPTPPEEAERQARADDEEYEEMSGTGAANSPAADASTDDPTSRGQTGRDRARP